VGYEKPHPRIFELALSKACVSPSEAIHVGDSYYHDVVGAEGVGITPVLLDGSGRYACEDLGDCIRIESLSELLSIV